MGKRAMLSGRGVLLFFIIFIMASSLLAGSRQVHKQKQEWSEHKLRSAESYAEEIGTAAVLVHRVDTDMDFDITWLEIKQLMEMIVDARL